MSPRNPKAFEEGQAVRAAVREILAAHPPLAWPLTAKAINARLPVHLQRDVSTICGHMRAIRCENSPDRSLQRECIG
jgi:hypothetical protein